MVYGMEPGAMRFLNMLGNKAFAGVLTFPTGSVRQGHSWCGTKVLHCTALGADLREEP